MYVELNKHISYRPIKKKIKSPVSRRLRPAALVVDLLYYINA